MLFMSQEVIKRNIILSDHNRSIGNRQCMCSLHHCHSLAPPSPGYCWATDFLRYCLSLCLSSTTVYFCFTVCQDANNPWNRHPYVFTSVMSRTNSRGCSVFMSKGQKIAMQHSQRSHMLLPCSQLCFTPWWQSTENCVKINALYCLSVHLSPNLIQTSISLNSLK